MKTQNDFSKGPVWKNILAQALPLTIAQFVHLLYNVMDRVYIGHMEGVGTMALTGVGLTFPVVTIILAFAALFGMGGVPLFSIARGAGEHERAGRIMGCSFTLILIAAAALTALGYAFLRPVLFAFGASGDSFVYANEYLRIYLAGTVFSMLATGMNGYINA
ncbi:MAG: MATE family efflux transporter, partial [Clostridia bacterium]|nr:MATE family efflux transporter [Clostridia bacterium]